MDLLINIDVPDLERAIDFYQRGLGLRLSRRLFGGVAAEMLGASSPIYLLVKAGGTAPAPEVSTPRCYARHWTAIHLDFAVPDLAAAVEQAVAAGATLEQPPQTFGWGLIAMLSDPFGHGFCLVQWVGEGYAAAE